MLAVWSKANRPHPYVEGIVRGIEIYRDMIEGFPAVVMGEFNSNAIWDASHPADRSHTALVARLEGLGLVSSYHHFHAELHGRENRPTYYFQWKQERPFHIDYCFVPATWAAKLKRVEVGGFDGWNRYSDHRPLLSEFGIP